MEGNFLERSVSIKPEGPWLPVAIKWVSALENTPPLSPQQIMGAVALFMFSDCRMCARRSQLANLFLNWLFVKCWKSSFGWNQIVHLFLASGWVLWFKVVFLLTQFLFKEVQPSVMVKDFTTDTNKHQATGLIAGSVQEEAKWSTG